MHRTTIALSGSVRDRLKSYGPKGMTYEEILSHLMDAITPEELEDRRFRPPYVHAMSEAQRRALRVMEPEAKLMQAHEMWEMAAKTNPRGLRSLIQSRRTHAKRR